MGADKKYSIALFLMPTTSNPLPTYALSPFKESENADLSARIEAIRQKWGKRLVILGHHY